MASLVAEIPYSEMLEDIWEYYRASNKTAPEKELYALIAEKLTEVAGPPEPWSARYPEQVRRGNLKPSKAFVQALGILGPMLEAGAPDVYQGTIQVQVFALPGRVAPGAVILGESRPCKRTGCRVNFVPRVWNQRYCSPECKVKHREELKQAKG